MRPMPAPDLSIIIVNWNTKAMLQDCLKTVYAGLGKLSAEVFVVDNASADGSPAMVESDFPHAILIRNKVNRGFAAANNQALKRAKGRHVLLLNSDTLVHGDVLARSGEYLEQNPEVGAMGCRVLNADGSVQLTCSAFPGLGNLLLLTSGLAKLPLFRKLDVYRYQSWQRDSERDVDVISGCYMLLRAEVIRQVGRLDESFFFFGEETDWCRRIAKAGWKLRFAPVGEITHYGGGSSGSLNHKRDLLLSEATVRLHRKHGGLACALTAFAILLVFNASRLAFWQLAAPLMRSGKASARRKHFWGVVANFLTAWPREKRA